MGVERVEVAQSGDERLTGLRLSHGGLRHRDFVWRSCNRVVSWLDRVDSAKLQKSIRICRYRRKCVGAHEGGLTVVGEDCNLCIFHGIFKHANLFDE